MYTINGDLVRNTEVGSVELVSSSARVSPCISFSAIAQYQNTLFGFRYMWSDSRDHTL